jgi:hypothetical protein
MFQYQLVKDRDKALHTMKMLRNILVKFDKIVEHYTSLSSKKEFSSSEEKHNAAYRKDL